VVILTWRRISSIVGSVKVAVSLPEELFTQVEAVAADLKVPRSRVYANALEEYVRHWENRRLSEQLDAAYADGLTDEDREFLEYSRRAAARVAALEPEEW
jgi:metal-responsive CopG/Arc/MetJ family transcriptional regulator